MGTMKLTSFKGLLLIVAALGLTACQEKKDPRQGITTRGTGPRAANQAAAGGVQLQGRVQADPSYQQYFQDAVNGLLSTDVRPDYIGFVSANGQNNSGVFIGGQIVISGGTLANFNGSGTIASQSRIVIQVRDFFPQMPNAPALPAIALSNAQGSINGNYVEVMFSDGFGSITLSGYIDTYQRVFTGTVKYDNQILYDGSRPGAAGELGDFMIPMCSIFQCQ